MKYSVHAHPCTLNNTRMGEDKVKHAITKHNALTPRSLPFVRFSAPVIPIPCQLRSVKGNTVSRGRGGGGCPPSLAVSQTILFPSLFLFLFFFFCTC